jgi:hypothetical protein
MWKKIARGNNVTGHGRVVRAGDGGGKQMRAART